jgi:glycosyltransferase involved in cell wall biosynthesis
LLVRKVKDTPSGYQHALATGYVSDYEELKALYAICDIFVLPSFEEGDPIALKEALASGKPLIGSNVGGIPMQIEDGWNGFLIEPGNEKQLYGKIKYLIENEDVRKRMEKNSRKLAEEEFDWNKIVDKYFEVYKYIMVE